MIHFLSHILGIDSTTSHWYAFWSGIGGDIAIFTPILFGIRGLKRHHKQSVDALHNHLDQQLAKLTEVGKR